MSDFSISIKNVNIDLGTLIDLFNKKFEKFEPLASRFKPFKSFEELEKEKEKGPERKLIGFELDERGIPRHDYDIVDADGNNIGIVTSGTMSPSLGKGIGLGYVPTEFSAIGSKIHIQIRKNSVPATVVKLPFYKG